MVDTVMADSSKKQCDKDLGPGHYCFHHQRSGSGPHAWKVAPPVVLVPAVDMVISETQEGTLSVAHGFVVPPPQAGGWREGACAAAKDDPPSAKKAQGSRETTAASSSR